MKKLEEIRSRAEKATEGPWELRGGGEWIHPFGIEVGPMDEGEIPVADAEFIAHSRTDVPKLVAALEAVEGIGPYLLSEHPTQQAVLVAKGWDSARSTILRAIQEALQ